MTLAGFITYSGALAIAAAIPGPGVTALVARALGSGFRSSLFMALGLMLGDLTYLTAVVLGLAFVAQTFGMVFLAIKWLGVAYLAWLAYAFWTAGITPTMSIAHKGAVVGAKVLAASVLDLMTSPELRAAAKKQFEEDTKETKYFSLLPPDAKPPLDLNKEIMDKYRPEMRKFYLNKKADFK